MGNSLERPVTEKTTIVGNSSDDGLLAWGVSSMQGWRISMEDAHICSQADLAYNHYLFCVFDGHGGNYAALYCQDHFMNVLKKQSSFQQYVDSFVVSPTTTKKGKPKMNKRHQQQHQKNNRTSKRHELNKERQCHLLQQALEDTFVDLDLQLWQDMIEKGMYQDLSLEATNNTANTDTEAEWGAFTETETMDDDHMSSQNQQGEDIPGTTAIAVLVTPDFIICANAGDSRATLANTTSQPIALSRDHKPTLPDEQERIEKAKGVVAFGGRVDGELAVSRALGDYGFKDYHAHTTSVLAILDSDSEDRRNLAQQLKVSPFPETSIHTRSEQDQLLMLACDGIWDVMTNTQCIELAQMLFAEGESKIGLIAEEILDMCLKKGSRDNMTIIIVKFPGQGTGSGGGVMKRRSQRESKR